MTLVKPESDATGSPTWVRARQRLFEAVLAALFVALVAPLFAGVAAFMALPLFAPQGAGDLGVLGLLGVLTGAYLLGILPSMLAGATVPFLAARLGRHATALCAALVGLLAWGWLNPSPWAASRSIHLADLVLPACAALGLYAAVVLHVRRGHGAR